MDIYKKIALDGYAVSDDIAKEAYPRNFGLSKILDKEKRHVAIAHFRAEQQRKTLEFKHDLLYYLGIVDHPKAERFYQLLWDDYHSHGLLEVVLMAEEYVDLLK